jgi:hypothetical protein
MSPGPLVSTVPWRRLGGCGRSAPGLASAQAPAARRTSPLPHGRGYAAPCASHNYIIRGLPGRLVPDAQRKHRKSSTSRSPARPSRLARGLAYEPYHHGKVKAVVPRASPSLDRRSGPHARIAICFVEWSGAESQKLVIDWTLVSDADTAGTVSKQLLKLTRSFADRTSISEGLLMKFLQRQRSRRACKLYFRYWPSRHEQRGSRCRLLTRSRHSLCRASLLLLQRLADRTHHVSRQRLA